MGKLRRTVVYQIDSDDNIVSVNKAWSEFARANDGAELADRSVLNTPLWKYIVDKETKHIYKILFGRVRSEQKKITFPFRCDSPAVRRFMELELLPLQHNGIELKAFTLKEESRRQMTLLDSLRGTTRSHVMICSWCKKVKVKDRWLEIEDALIRLDLFGETELPGLTHGVCPCCKEILEEAIAEELANHQPRE